MSTAGETKIFGIRIKVDPKILISGLVLLTVAFIWFQLHGSDDDHPAASVVRPVPTPTGSLTSSNRAKFLRRGPNSRGDRSTLRLEPIDPAKGDIDPTLRLDLLSRLKQVAYSPSSRNLFDSGPVAGASLPPVPVVPPIIPKPLPGPETASGPVPPPRPAVNIPFRYYGFAKPGLKTDSNRGFFMEGDNILIATEGDVLEQRYLVVALTPLTARVEDIQLKQGQDLQFTPEAAVPQ